MTQRCPDCGGRMLDPNTETAFCSYKRTFGYGTCGVPRPLPSLYEAATALRAVVHGDRDYQNMVVPLRDSFGRRRREWDDFAYALERAASPTAGGLCEYDCDACREAAEMSRAATPTASPTDRLRDKYAIPRQGSMETEYWRGYAEALDEVDGFTASPTADDV